MTMNEMKKWIQKSFTEQYGFKPAQKSIIPLEYGTYGKEEHIEFIGFRVGNIGYTCKPYEQVKKCDAYDKETE